MATFYKAEPLERVVGKADEEWKWYVLVLFIEIVSICFYVSHKLRMLFVSKTWPYHCDEDINISLQHLETKVARR
jgi:hypothetical protein